MKQIYVAMLVFVVFSLSAMSHGQRPRHISRILPTKRSVDHHMPYAPVIGHSRDNRINSSLYTSSQQTLTRIPYYGITSIRMYTSEHEERLCDKLNQLQKEERTLRTVSVGSGVSIPLSLLAGMYDVPILSDISGPVFLVSLFICLPAQMGYTLCTMERKDVQEKLADVQAFRQFFERRDASDSRNSAKE